MTTSTDKATALLAELSILHASLGRLISECSALLLVPAAASGPTGPTPAPVHELITPKAAPVLSTMPGRPVRVASVGPGTTRSAAPAQAPFVPQVARPAPSSSVGIGQATKAPITVESILAAQEKNKRS